MYIYIIDVVSQFIRFQWFELVTSETSDESVRILALSSEASLFEVVNKISDCVLVSWLRCIWSMMNSWQ